MSYRVLMTFYTYLGDEPIRVPIIDGQPKIVVQPGERFESSYKLDSQLFKTDEQLEAHKARLKEEAGKKDAKSDDADVESLKAQILALDPEAKIHPQTGAAKLKEKLDALLEKKAQDDADAKAKEEAEAGKTGDAGTVPPTDETNPPAQ